MSNIVIRSGRAPNTDYNRWADSLIDQYKNIIDKKEKTVKEETWLAHPVQKEAIQNSADAYNQHSKDTWETVFEIDESFPPKFISITDKGTFGLTGKAIVSKNVLDSLQKNAPNKYQKERWAKFESLSYPNIDETGRGSRGQGKWVFIGASLDKTIFYDTFTEDKTYRVGAWLGQDQLIEFPPEGVIAKRFLIQNIPSIKPLESIGTRIIIYKPKEELWKGFLPFINSPIESYIGQTWWELLKEGKNIKLKWKEETKEIKCPIYYEDEYIEKNTIEEFWISDEKLNWKNNEKTKVKEFVLIYSKKVIPEEYRGISVQRNGMKICTVEASLGNHITKREHLEHIYGWIILDENGEKELRKIEDPTHYDFRASIGTIGYHLFGRVGWLSEKLREFAEQRLGLNNNEKDFDRLDILVANKLNQYLRQYYEGLPLDKPTPPPKGKEKKKRKKKKIRIKMNDFEFPEEGSRKLNYGDSLENIGFSIINNTKNTFVVRASLNLKTASKTIQERILRNLLLEDLKIEGESESKSFGPFNISFERENFDQGTYVIEAEIIILDGKSEDSSLGKGVITDQERELIYLEVNPPTGKGIFEFIDRVEFKEDKELQFRIKQKEGKMRIEINIAHPAYKSKEMLDGFLKENNLYRKFKGNNPLLDYELGIGAEAIAQYDLSNELKFIIDNKEDFLEKRKNDENAFFLEAVDEASKIAQRIRYDVIQ